MSMKHGESPMKVLKTDPFREGATNSQAVGSNPPAKFRRILFGLDNPVNMPKAS